MDGRLNKHLFRITPLIAACLLSSCVLYRHDIEVDRDSVTAWTLFKDFDISIDPNSIRWDSTSQKVQAITPYGAVETSK